MAEGEGGKSKMKKSEVSAGAGGQLELEQRLWVQMFTLALTCRDYSAH